jgi:hypothetical protein
MVLDNFRDIIRFNEFIDTTFTAGFYNFNQYIPEYTPVPCADDLEFF